MTDNEALLTVIDALNELGIPYALVGSYASNLYGVPRSTQDADFVVEIREGDVDRLRERLAPLLRLDRQASFETITGSTQYLIRTPRRRFKVELFVLNEDPHNQEHFRRRVRHRLLDRDVWFPTPEDVVVTKLRWSKRGKRLKDLDDAQNVLAVQQDRLDWDYVRQWCTNHGTLDLLEELRAQIPPI